MKVARGLIAPAVLALALGRGRRRKRIFPADIVPVIDMEGERQHVAPHRKLAEKRIGRRTGAAALRGEEFDHDRILVGHQFHRAGRRNRGRDECEDSNRQNQASERVDREIHHDDNVGRRRSGLESRPVTSG